ncbi:MAG: hypothetical protein WAV38_20185 [Xanthobacteraceae bacterium]
MSRKRAAIHEASHSVIGRVLGFPCGPASITSHGGGGAAVAPAHSLHWNSTDTDIHASVMKKIIVCWAGGEAERIVFGGADDAGDRRQIESLARRFYVSDEDIEAARTRARQLVVSNWRKIELVAAALSARKSLSGSEIDDIMIFE